MRLFSIFNLIICFFIWLAASIWATYTVGRGLITAQNFSGYPEWAIYGFAGLLQATISYCALYIPELLRKWKFVAAAICLMVMLFFQSGELFHQIIAQIKNSQGTGLVNTQKSAISAFNTEIIAQNTNIQQLAQGLLASYEREKQRAEAGDDESGMSGCEDICRSAIAKRTIVDRYIGALSNNLTAPAPSLSSLAVRDALDETLARLGLLESRNNTLSLMVQEINAVITKTGSGQKITGHNAISNAIKKIRDNIVNYVNRLDGLNEVTETDLAMQKSFEVLKNFITLDLKKINERSWLSIFYGIASLLAIIVAALLIRHLQHTDTDELEKDIVRERKRAELFKQLREAKFARSVAESFVNSFNSVRDKFRKEKQ